MKIGFDLDNTIVDYSQAVLEYACTLDSCQAKTVSELEEMVFCAKPRRPMDTGAKLALQ